MAIPAFTRITRAAAVSLAAVALIGVAAPAASAADQSDPIAPVPDQWGRHYVDAWASNTTENTSPDTNAAIGLLSTMESYWKPEVPLTPEWDADGTFLPESVGTVINGEVLDANIAITRDIAANRTPEQAAQSWIIDRRNQNYSAIGGLGPWAGAFRDGTNTGTTIPDEVPDDATTVRYDDEGNANGNWAEEDSAYGSIVQLVNTIRDSAASTNPSKSYYSYARPFRWSDEVQVLPELMPVKKDDSEAMDDGGYPSGHTNAGWLATYALAYSAPERFSELLTNASEIGNSRIVAGMHSAMDVVGGRIMSSAVAAAALNQPENQELLDQAREAGAALMETEGTGEDPWADRAGNETLYAERLTYGLPRVGDTTLPVVVPKGAEALLETRLPYLTDEQRRWVLQSTGLESGYALLDDAEGWGRMNLFAAADGYSAFDTDVVVDMDAAAGGFSAADTWRNDIEGAGSLTKSGTGSLTLSGENSYTGDTTVTGGELIAASATAFGTGSVATADEAVLADDADETLRIAGNLDLAPTGTLSLTLDSDAPALAVERTASFGGALEVAFADGVVPGDDVVVATFGDVADDAQFSSLTVTGAPEGYDPEVEIRDGAVHLVEKQAEPSALIAGEPVVDGAATAGTTLTVDPGAWGPEPVEFDYQWLRGEQAISGATSATYALTHEDVGQTISVAVTGSKPGFDSATATAVLDGTVVAVLTLSADRVAAGDSLTLDGTGFAPGESVRVELHSTSVDLGDTTAADDGSVHADVTIPSGTDAGAHTVVVTGAETGNSASAALDVDGAPSGGLAPTGGSAAPALIGGALALIGLGTAFVIARIRTARRV